MPEDRIDCFPFVQACENGDEERARVLYAEYLLRGKSILNSWHRNTGKTGLVLAIINGHNSICRWLLSLPGIDVNDGFFLFVAIHAAAAHCDKTPLDVVITVAKMTSKHNINRKLPQGEWEEEDVTALDIAVQKTPLSTAIYLSWLGAECKEENKKFGDVTLQTWLDAGCHQDAPMWAVAANDLSALKQLDSMEEVSLDKPILINLAKLFGHQEIKCYLENNQHLKIYTNQVFCDFEITFNEMTFPCHKIFLAKQSEPFQALIADKMKRNLPMTTELLNCPNETVAESFLKFFYIGGIDKDLLDVHTVSFLHLSDYYRVEGMHTIIEDSMITDLTKKNVKEFLIAADMYRGEKVKTACFAFLSKNRGVWSENIEEWKPFISRELLCEIAIKLA